MPGFDFQQAVVRQRDKHRKAGRGMVIAAAFGWLLMLAVGGGVGWLLDLFEIIKVNGVGLANYGTLIMLVFLLAGTAWFYFNRDAEIEVRDEPSFIEEVTGNHEAFASEVGFAFLLVVPKMTADGLCDLTNSLTIPEDQLPAAERIACELHDKNDWLPLHHYHQDLKTVAGLVRMDILRSKEVRGQPYVRLNPSLYD